MGQFVTTLQLAKRLDMTRANVIYHIHQGHIAAEQPGGRDFLITEAEAERVVALYQPHKHLPWRGVAEGSGNAGQEAQSA